MHTYPANRPAFITIKTVQLFLVMQFIVYAEKLTVDFNVDQIGRIPLAPLRCTFSETMIRIGFPKNSVPKGLLIEPPISGIWSWESQSTLIFTPDSEWPEVNFYTATVPAGTESTISLNRLKRAYTIRFSTGLFSVNCQNPRELRSTIDTVILSFSLPVHPDSLRNHLTGAPPGLALSMIDDRTAGLLPRGGWPAGHRITLSIDGKLTPFHGNLQLDTVLSTSFIVSDTLSCLGLFRNGKKISPSDTLFLEDNYTIRFNRQLHSHAFQDYVHSCGRPAEFNWPGTEIDVNRYLTPGKPCTLSLSAGLPSIDSAFLFNDVRFVLVADSGRIDPELPPLTISGVTVRYADKDSIVPISLNSAPVIPLTMAMKFAFSVSPANSCDEENASGRIYYLSPKQTDTLQPFFESGLSVYPISYPVQSICTLMVKAGFRTCGRQLKKDYRVSFRTGSPRINKECRPVINTWEDNLSCREYGRESHYFLLPDSPAVPLERLGTPRVVSALRNIPVAEALSLHAQKQLKPHHWIYDTLPPPASEVNWYEFLPIPLAPALSPFGRGCAEVLFSVNNAPFDTLGRFDVTDIGLRLIYGRLATGVLVTSLTKRTPVAGADVAFVGKTGTMLTRGTTDSLGFLRIGGFIAPQFVTVTVPGDTFVHESGWRYAGDTLVAGGVFFTERGLYRTGDTIYFKGIVRRQQDRWVPAIADSVVVTISWKGAPQVLDTFPMTGIGSFTGAIAVPATVTHGVYEIIAQPFHARCYLRSQITIADFRPAELTGSIGEGIVNGDSVRFQVSTKWLHGGPAGGCPFSWRCGMYRTRKNPSVPVEFGNNQELVDDAEESGTSLLDSTGKAVIAVLRQNNDSGAGYVLSVKVNGSAQQSLQMYKEAYLPWGHRIRIGVLPPMDAVNNDTVVYSLMTIRENGEIVKKCTLHISIAYHKEVRRTAKNRCGLPAIIRDTVNSPLPKRQIVTDSTGTGMLRLLSLPAGSYTIKVSAPGVDASGSYIDDFTVNEPTPHQLQRKNEATGEDEYPHKEFADSFTISEIDTGLHHVGDTVRVRLKTAMDSCRVALIVCRENLYDYRWMEMTGRDTVIALTISDIHIPAVYVAASMLPPLRKKKGRFTFFQPTAVVTASVRLRVSAEPRRIPVQVATDRTSYAPGDSVTVDVTIPPKFASSTALVMAVDEGVLRRCRSPMPAIFEKFDDASSEKTGFYINGCFKCLHGQFDYDSANNLEIPPRRDTAVTGYGFGYGDDSGGSGGIDDLIGSLMGDLMGEDGGNGLDRNSRGARIIRNPPRPCAYFNPQVTFDDNGKAICRFKLPGNLTRWRITAVVDDTTSFGEDTTSFESNKPLMVRPQLPRFLRTGDSASAVYIVENRSKKPLKIASLVMARSDTTVDTFQLRPDEIRHCRFPLIGRAAGFDSLLFIARSDTVGDGTKQTLPTIFERNRDLSAIGGSTLDSIRIPIILPDSTEVDSGSISLSLSTTRMQNLAEGARYLFEYPYHCLEQQTSRIMPMLLLKNFVQRFNLPMLSKGDEQAIIRTYLDHLGNFQNSTDGGFGYWPSDSIVASPWLTAFVLESMIRAKGNGYSINDSVFTRALRYLQREMLRSDSGDQKQYLDSYTLLLTALAGAPDRPALRRLYKKTKALPYPAQINLLRALHAAGGFKRKVAVVQKTLRKGLIEKDRLAYLAPGEAQGFEFCHESPVRLTALTLEALLETGSKSRFDEPMLRWLTEQRREGRWRTTQENQAVFKAFAAYTNVYEHAAPKLSAAVKLAGSDWLSATLEGREGAVARASRPLDSVGTYGVAEVDITSSGSGRLYWDLTMNTFKAAYPPATSSGLSITRTVAPIGETAQTHCDPSRLYVGQLLRITGTVRCNQDITFAAINDPVPAGCEAVNPELITGEQDIALKYTIWSGPAGLSHREFRDSRVLLFADEMPAGEYRYSYLLKVTTAGKFRWPAPSAAAMYYPEIFGRGEEGSVDIIADR